MIAKLLCKLGIHKWVSMKDVANPNYHDCEWCKICMRVRDFNKHRKYKNLKNN